MKATLRSFVLAAGLWLTVFAAHSGAASPALLKAKQEAESKGYIFATSHDEIVAAAKKEGRMRAVSFLSGKMLDAMARAFRAKYPFLDVHVEEQGGSVEAAQRFLLEIKAGVARDWDANRLWTELYDQYLPYQKKFDILGMAEHKVLNIPPPMVDPVHRHVVALSSNLHVLVYNTKLVPPEQAPGRWEDLLRPEFKGKKFASDIRPVGVAALVAAWGLEKTLDFAKRIAAQQPVWVRGHTIVISAVQTGEIPMFMGTNFGAVKRAQAKDRARVLGYKFLEPVVGRLHLTDGVLAAARHPYAALLWLEFQASPEGQKLLDEHWPFGGSVLLPDSVQAQETKGKKVFLIDWNHYTKLDEYTAKVAEAYGFPRAEVK
ncbi:MAG TPA: ABC transporter substrate-binding protein [Candidatus Acidoferrales bacterium]|nr:ABC transporter substrate-binding protein [Candidatus Acidoferrales bacterium]